MKIWEFYVKMWLRLLHLGSHLRHKDAITGEYTICTANEDGTPCPKDERIVFEKFTSASSVSGTVFTESKVCMVSILYSKPGDNGTWIMFEQAFGFGAWVSKDIC